MKKTTILCFIFSLCCKGILSQTKTVSLKIGDKSVIKHLSQTKDSGFMVLTGHDPKYGYMPEMKTSNYMMRFFDSELNEVWSYKPDNQDYYPYFISSDVTDYKYWFDYDYDYNSKIGASKTSLNKQVRLIRFNKKGMIDKIDVKIQELSEKYYLLAAFSDKENFHFITNNMMVGVGKKNRVSEAPFLYSLNHTGGQKFTKIKININLEKGGTLGYLGTNSEKIYLYQQRFVSENIINATIFVINSSGELLQEFELNNICSEGKYFKTHYYERGYIGDYMMNFSMSTSNLLLVTDNCFGELKIDFRNNSIFFISFLIDNKKKSTYNVTNCEITDVYLAKFNLSGMKIKSNEFSYNSLIESSSVSVRAMKLVERASVNYFESEKFIVKLFGDMNKNVVFFISLKETKVVEKSENELNYDYSVINKQDGNFAVIDYNETIKNLKGQKYLNSLDKNNFKKSTFIALNSNENCFLFQYTNQKDDNLLDIMLFN